MDFYVQALVGESLVLFGRGFVITDFEKNSTQLETAKEMSWFIFNSLLKAFYCVGHITYIKVIHSDDKEVVWILSKRVGFTLWNEDDFQSKCIKCVIDGLEINFIISKRF